MNNKRIITIATLVILLNLLVLSTSTANAGLFSNIGDSIKDKMVEITDNVMEKVEDSLISPLKDEGIQLDENIQQTIENMTNVLGEEKKLYIAVPEEVNEKDSFIVKVTDHEGNPVSKAKIWLRLEKYITNDTGKAELVAPDVDENEDYMIFAEKIMYIPGSSKITVSNIDTKLQILVKPEVYSEEKFDVVVLNGENETIENTTIKFDGSTKKTDEEGLVTFKAPEVTHDRPYEINASKSGYESDSEEITVKPSNTGALGFLCSNWILISVFIAIISVALIAMRKYKQHFWY